jgi:hypothetical protein
MPRESEQQSPGHHWEGNNAPSNHWSHDRPGGEAPSKLCLTALTLNSIAGTLARFHEFFGGRLSRENLWTTDWTWIGAVQSLILPGVRNLSQRLPCKEDDGQKYEFVRHDTSSLIYCREKEISDICTPVWSINYKGDTSQYSPSRILESPDSCPDSTCLINASDSHTLLY